MKIIIEKKVITNIPDLLKWVALQSDGVYAITRWRNARSNDQNAYYWALLELVQDHTGMDKDDIHEKMKYQFLSVAVPSGQLPYCRSTSKLDTKEFTDYIENMKNFMAERI
jgi:hypothetical protein